ncbi:chromosome segregation protein SMC [Nitrosovibrio sp. Nv6]|uniref:chromosome segregation protein SMC n=1 Tax=Nitrosovibrio sp. Nv6 TaxID=1855340 RepID=UPI0008CF1051|nr:chromosome segregation protein SMC [Nitrosovibrio sp. Nv6]SEP32508.1 condensin subunit Smc [Nitrosovibrio sp. Nv6]
MRLSHIKLAGFKSFVDPTEIPLPGDLIGVVGPNGCGKSNVIDAVRWVLGESRASALRGESMQDVIFNGSANRKPIGRASVELMFDNSLGRAAGQWSSYAEICIKRVLRRDGESTYHINNIHVRRRDIADIFLGTGIGGRGYAIIEQGMISRIIEAKPEELRVFLEEAAGISRYRERRRETESRLADTRENLLRVNDICRELEKQLIRLEQQAKIASRFKDMEGQLHRVQNLLWCARKQEAALQRVLAEKELQSLQTALEAETTSLRRAEKYLEEKRAQHYATSDRLHQAQGELYAANAEVAQTEQQIRHMRENRQRIAQQIMTTRNQLEQKKKQAEDAADSLNGWQGELEQACLVREAGKEKAAAENEKLPLADSAFRSCQEKLTETQRSLLLVEQAGQLEESHRAHAKKNLQQLESRRIRLLTERDALRQPEIEELSRLNRQTEITAADLKHKKEMLAETEDLLLNAEEVKGEVGRKVRMLEQQVIQAEARLNALQRLQARLEDSEGLNAWLVKRQLDVSPRLWQGIQIEKGWEDALEAVLRERLNSAQLEQLEVAHEWADDPPPGKCALFESARPEAQGTQGIQEIEGAEGKPAGDKPQVRESWKTLHSYLVCHNAGTKSVLDEWLSDVFVAESVQAGLSQRTGLSSSEMLVTREGHIITCHSLTYYAPDSQLHGVLARQREIAQIKVEVDALRGSLSVERSAMETAEEACQALESSVSGLRYDSIQLQQQHHDAQMQTLKLTQLAERTGQRRKQIDGELAEIEQQGAAEGSRKQDAETKLTGYQVQIGILQDQVQKQKLAQQAAEQFLNAQRQLAQKAAREMQEAAFHEKNCQDKIVETENSIRIIDESVFELKAHLEKLQAEQGEFDEMQLNSLLQERLTLREQREHVLAAVRNALEDVTRELREIEQARMTSEQKLSPLREAISQVRLKEQEARITEDRFGEQLRESGGLEEELIQSLGKTRPSALQTEINHLNAEIAALGAVNPAALDELQSCQARKTYLDSQSQDLEEASETLKNAIRRIDRETRERLLETVDKVNSHLDEIFPTMFAGGQAKLILRGEEILDAGIQIFAQPPGKKNSSIHLLSGGEKALTALALVFSLFQLNPAPFCLLDEVDAPLDDTNTERFCNLVRKMSRQTQFVFISHNKITMEMAQQLIGVTMQEKGVSRVVAVEIEEAVGLSDAAMVT